MSGRREYVVIQQKLWMNEHGHGCDYIWDSTRHRTRTAALKAGWRELGHDDFNIGTLEDGRLVAFGWGDWDFGPEHGDDEPHGGYDLAEVAHHGGLTAGAR